MSTLLVGTLPFAAFGAVMAVLESDLHGAWHELAFGLAIAGLFEAIHPFGEALRRWMEWIDEVDRTWLAHLLNDHGIRAGDGDAPRG
ncbi:MAG: hypothetical protein ACYDH6_24040 [Acidimicrobiales bacterium]